MRFCFGIQTLCCYSLCWWSQYQSNLLGVLWQQKLSSWTKQDCQKPTLIAAVLKYLYMIWTPDKTRFSHATSGIIHFYHISHFQIATTTPLKLTVEPTLFIPVSLPMALDFKRGRIAKIPWPDCMIKQPTDKVLALEVACCCVPPCVVMRKEKLWYLTDTAL